MPKLISTSSEQAPFDAVVDTINRWKISHSVKLQQLRSNRQIQASSLGTWQGRVTIFVGSGVLYDSANGCTVIAFVCALCHVRSSLTAEGVLEIVDHQAIHHLHAIRKASSTSLTDRSFLLHDDVSSYFHDTMDSASNFLNHMGGSVFTEDFEKFLDVMKFGNGKRSAAFLLQKHMVCITKCCSGQFEVIESLEPGERILFAGVDGLRTHVLHWACSGIVKSKHALSHIAMNGYSAECAHVLNSGESCHVFQAHIFGECLLNFLCIR
jgi:hypothetical protein